MEYEQFGMDLSGVKSYNYARQADPYKKGMGMIAAYGRGPKGKKCRTCGKYKDNMGVESCKVIPWADINRKTDACGRYEEKE